MNINNIIADHISNIEQKCNELILIQKQIKEITYNNNPECINMLIELFKINKEIYDLLLKKENNYINSFYNVLKFHLGSCKTIDEYLIKKNNIKELSKNKDSHWKKSIIDYIFEIKENNNIKLDNEKNDGQSNNNINYDSNIIKFVGKYKKNYFKK
jgi:hypothetical protein